MQFKILFKILFSLDFFQNTCTTEPKPTLKNAIELWPTFEITTELWPTLKNTDQVPVHTELWPTQDTWPTDRTTDLLPVLVVVVLDQGGDQFYGLQAAPQTDPQTDRFPGNVLHQQGRELVHQLCVRL